MPLGDDADALQFLALPAFGIGVEAVERPGTQVGARIVCEVRPQTRRRPR
jgi:hypothetical protein